MNVEIIAARQTINEANRICERGLKSQALSCCDRLFAHVQPLNKIRRTSRQPDERQMADFLISSCWASRVELFNLLKRDARPGV